MTPIACNNSCSTAPCPTRISPASRNCPFPLDRLLDASLASLPRYVRSGELRGPAQYRLAFRELGLAIGLHAVKRMSQAEGSSDKIKSLRRYLPLGTDIESFWLDPAHQHADTWTEHLDINEVMLATRLAPDGFLKLGTDHGF